MGLNVVAFVSRITAPLSWLSILAAGSIAAFGAFFHFAILDPTNVSWLLTGDWGQHVVGWHALRNSDWAWPLTRTEAFYPGVGANTALMDANPLVSLMLRPFAPLLPDHFQFIGPWFLACVFLQALFAYLLLRPYATRAIAAAFAALIFLAWPQLYFRAAYVMVTGHDTLMGQWIIVAAMWAYLTIDWRTRVRRFTWVLALGALVHPHLFLMAAAIWGGSVLREAWLWRNGLRSRQHTTQLAVTVLTPIVVCAAVMVAVGSLPAPGGGKWGFGEYSMNLNALINPMYDDHSRYLPNLGRVSRQYEGFQFLGLGLLALLVGALLLARLVRPVSTADQHDAPARPHLAWLTAPFIALTLIALSSTVRLGDLTLIDIPLTNEIRYGVFNIVRASGRFFWPVVYLALFLAARTLVRRGAGVTLAAVAATLTIQALDISPFAAKMRDRTASSADRSFQVVTDPVWPDLVRDAELVVFIPAYHSYNMRMVMELAWVAIDVGTPLGTMYMSRRSRPQARSDERANTAFAAGERHQSHVYVFPRPCEVDFAASDRPVTVDGVVLLAQDSPHLRNAPAFDARTCEPIGDTAMASHRATR